MSLIPASVIAYLTENVDEAAMNDTATITTVTRVDDGGGSYTETTTTVTSPCYLWTLTGDETDGDQVRALGRHRIALPKTVTVAQTGRITVSGRAYQVMYVFPLTGYSTSRIIGLEDAA